MHRQDPAAWRAVTLPDIAPARGSRQVVGPLGEGLAPLPFDSLLTSFS